MTEADPKPALTVVVDFKQPQSYLAVAPTVELAADLGLELEWLPTVARPLVSASEAVAGDDRGARHLRFRSKYLERDLRRYSETQGLALGDLRRTPDSRLAGRSLLWASKAMGGRPAGVVLDFVHAVFDGYWTESLDLESLDDLRGALQSANIAPAAFDATSLLEEERQLESRLRGAGVIAAPSYLLGEEIFVGREHLPMIRWLLEGKRGAPPI